MNKEAVILNEVKNLSLGEEERFFSGRNVYESKNVNGRFRMTLSLSF